MCQNSAIHRCIAAYHRAAATVLSSVGIDLSPSCPVMRRTCRALARKTPATPTA
jgi:hypothetical protein